MNTYRRRPLPLLCVLCLLAAALAMFGVPITAFAADTVLKIDTRIGEEPVKDIPWSVYRIGSRNVYGGIDLAPAFAESGAVLDAEHLTEEDVKAAVNKLESFIESKQLEADSIVKSDENGIAELNAGEAGVFFVRMDDISLNGYLYSALPAIAEVSAGETASIIPKLEAEKITAPDDSSKTNAGDSGSSNEGDDNSGRKTGADSDESDGSGSKRPGDDNSGDNPGKTPQTGQLWWPVPVLSVIGLVLIALGLRIHSGKGGKNDQ